MYPKLATLNTSDEHILGKDDGDENCQITSTYVQLIVNCVYVMQDILLQVNTLDSNFPIDAMIAFFNSWWLRLYFLSHGMRQLQNLNNYGMISNPCFNAPCV